MRIYPLREVHPLRAKHRQIDLISESGAYDDGRSTLMALPR